MDLRSLHDNVRRNVAQIASNLRQASSRAAELCQQALMPPPGNAPLLAVRRRLLALFQPAHRPRSCHLSRTRAAHSSATAHALRPLGRPLFGVLCSR